VRWFGVERFAGAGAMGLVYRALDRETGGWVALKVVSHGSADRFLREARVLAEVAHPHIVRYVHHGHTDAREPYLAMEWLEGVDLSHRLLSGPLPLAAAIGLARRVAGALGAAHARGVVHRDVKPSNLFLVGGEPAAVKVLDFGAARFVQTTSVPTASGIVLGTPGYLAPEQVHDEHPIDGRADTFALGCVLFECLTGRPTFVAQHVLALLGKILREDPPRLRAIIGGAPRDLEDLLAAMLAKKRSDRPSDMAAVDGALAKIEERAREDGTASIAGRLVFRWWSGEAGGHFYTSDASGERALQCGYIYEGVRFQMLAEGTPGAVPFYRWYTRDGSEHFYTADPSGETAPASGYEPEGILGYVATTALPGTVALHRWWNRSCLDHFYTTDERGELAARLGYEYQGVAGYVLAAGVRADYGSADEGGGTPPTPPAAGDAALSAGGADGAVVARGAAVEAPVDAAVAAAGGGGTARGA
jgi:hypothetical protein